MVSPLPRHLFVAAALGVLLGALWPHPAPAQEAVEPAPPDRWLDPDKPVHAFAGWWVAAATYGAAAAADADPAERRLTASAASLAAGVAKEVFDAAVQGEPFSWKDLTAGAAGLAALLALTLAAES